MDRRLGVLSKLTGLLNEHADEIATTMAIEMGKLIAQGQGEVKLCAGIATYYAEHARNMLKPVSYQSRAGDAWVEHHPIGVLVAVEPWNFLFYQLIRVAAPAIAVGNSVLIKHASIVPGYTTNPQKHVLAHPTKATGFVDLYEPRRVWFGESTGPRVSPIMYFPPLERCDRISVSPLKSAISRKSNW